MTALVVTGDRQIRPSARDVLVYTDMAESVYHGDPCPTPSISSTAAKRMLTHCPRFIWLTHPRLPGNLTAPDAEPDDSPAKLAGSLTHALLLGRGPHIEVVDADSWRTKKAKQARSDAQADGSIAVLQKHYDAAVVECEALEQELAEHDVTLDGFSEVSILWYMADLKIWGRARIDHIKLDERKGIIHAYDLKTVFHAHPETCGKQAAKFGYEIQQAAYTAAIRAAWPEFTGRRVKYKLIFAERGTGLVNVAPLGPIMVERGERKWNLATQKFSECLHSNNWPGYDQAIITPRWVEFEEDAAKYHE